MAIVDIDGVLVEANPAFYRMHGYSDGEPEGIHVSNILAKLGLASRTQAALWAVREGIAPGHNGIISPR